MTPLESILTGIKSQDWDLVVDGYNRLTGQKVSVVQQPTRTFPTMMNQTDGEYVHHSPKTSRGNDTQRKCRTENISVAKTNLFVDTGEEEAHLKQDVPKTKRNFKRQKVARQLIIKKCMVCGNDVEMTEAQSGNEIVLCRGCEDNLYKRGH